MTGRIGQLNILATSPPPSSFPSTVYCPAVLTYSLLQVSSSAFWRASKKGSEKIAPDAMKGNFYVSGRLGSNATSNPLPATPSTTTTRTHNHLQSHILFANSAATAALQNNRDDPHLAGNEACLCSSCHIKDSFFPRSQDGRIVLPHPTTISALSNSTRRHRHTASMTTPSSSASTHKRNRANSTASNRDREWGPRFWNLFVLFIGWTWVRLSVAKFNEGRRGAVLSTPQLQGDNAEGSFGGFGRIPGMCTNRCGCSLT